jgi:hypothetical protein
MLPFPPDSGLAPTVGFPLVCSASGEIFIETPDATFIKTAAKSWEDFRFDGAQLFVGNASIRCQSQRVFEVLTEGRKQGLTPPEAIARAWRLSVSPSRAKLEMKRWKLVTGSLRSFCPMLTAGFFLGLPGAYLAIGPLAALWLVAWLWVLMIAISLQLFWLGKKVYPSCRSALRQDAFLALVIPFHAMRALEITSVHAFARTHPAGILPRNHPWLLAFGRSLMNPRPGFESDFVHSETALPALRSALGVSGNTFLEYCDTAPDHSEDPSAVSYCPRCHGLFLSDVKLCADCRSMGLRKLEK